MRGRDGFTLIEALLGIFLIGLAMFSLLRFFSYGSLQMEKTVLRRQAMGLLEGRLEELRAVNRTATGGLAAEAGVYTDTMLTRRNGEAIRVEAEVATVVDGGRSDGASTFDSVYVAVTYDHGEIVDTVALATRFYDTN
jgi:type II secretory pathway pseudopilin PulG